MQKITNPLKANLLYFFLHFAISAWPFLNFYGSETNHKLISVSNFSSLFLLYWVLALVGCEIFRILFKIPREKTIVIYTFFVIWFFYYVSIWNLINITFNIKTYKFSLFYLLIMSALGYLSLRFSKSPAFLKAFQAFILVVFSYSLMENLFISIKGNNSFNHSKKDMNETYVFKRHPNIYFILLDTYSGYKSYKDNLKYDNMDFLNFFKRRGFIVAENAHSNYPNTTTSLSSTFKMNYLKKADINHSNVLSSDKEVFSVLRSNDYKFIIVPSHFEFLAAISNADITITPSRLFVFSLSNINFLRTSVLTLFQKYAADFLYFTQKEVNQIFDLSHIKRKFVFIHYMHLHDYVYGSACKFDMRSSNDRPSLNQFKQNISCFNKLVEGSIDDILSKDPESIIIVQGDHGSYWWRKEQYPRTSKEFEDMFLIFSAVYIPGLNKNSPIARYLSQSPSPVNNFRILFSYLSNTPLNLLQHEFYTHGLIRIEH